MSNRDGNYGVYWKAADGTGEIERLFLDEGGKIPLPSCWAGDGSMLALTEVYRGIDIGILSVDGDHEWKPLLKEDWNEGEPQISPDGRWMAYSSDESGRYEVYVCSFPEVTAGKWQVSVKRLCFKVVDLVRKAGCCKNSRKGYQNHAA